MLLTGPGKVTVAKKLQPWSPKTLQDASKTPQFGTTDGPRATQEPPKTAQDPPTSPPRAVQEPGQGRLGAMGQPGAAQEPPKGHPRAAQTPSGLRFWINLVTNLYHFWWVFLPPTTPSPLNHFVFNSNPIHKLNLLVIGIQS